MAKLPVQRPWVQGAIHLINPSESLLQLAIIRDIAANAGAAAPLVYSPAVEAQGAATPTDKP